MSNTDTQYSFSGAASKRHNRRYKARLLSAILSGSFVLLHCDAQVHSSYSEVNTNLPFPAGSMPPGYAVSYIQTQLFDLNNSNVDQEKAIMAAHTLGQIKYNGVDAYDGFYKLLHSKDRYSRTLGVDGLRNIGDSRALEALIGVFKDNRFNSILGQTALAISTIVTKRLPTDAIQTENIRQLLLAAFKKTDSPELIRCIYKALSMIGNPDDVRLFRYALGHDVTFTHTPYTTNDTALAHNVRTLANMLAEAQIAEDRKMIESLGRIGGDDAVKELLYILDNPQQCAPFRVTAAKTLVLPESLSLA